MRAKEYIRNHICNKVLQEQLNATLRRFADSRNNLSKTTRAYNACLKDQSKYVNFMVKCGLEKPKPESHWDFLQHLTQCIFEDKSYQYLLSCISDNPGKGVKPVPSSLIDYYILMQKEAYGYSTIDDFLYDDLNKKFYETIEYKGYTEQQEVEIFNRAFVAFDQIRQELGKPAHAAHIFKGICCDCESMTDDVLRLLSYLIKEYNYDITDEQRSTLDILTDKLGKYIQKRNSCQNRDSGISRWETLQVTLENMIHDEEKLELLICEKTSYQQLPFTQQFEAAFVTNCNLEIEKIRELQKVRQSSKPCTQTTDDDDSKTKGNNKIRYIVLHELLKKIGKGLKEYDRTKVCDFIAYIIGGSSKKIYNDSSAGIQLTNYHETEIKKVNKLLSDLDIEISVEKDKSY